MAGGTERSTPGREARLSGLGSCRYSRGMCGEAHGQKGVQERGGVAALELVGDLGIQLRLPRSHVFLLAGQEAPAHCRDQIK